MLLNIHHMNYVCLELLDYIFQFHVLLKHLVLIIGYCLYMSCYYFFAVFLLIIV